jgi:hypothetical protein
MGTLHAIALGLCVLITELACSRARDRSGEPPTLRRIALAVLVASTVGLSIAAVGLHRCDEGQPLQQWLIPAVCIGFVLAVVRHRRLELAATLALGSLALTLHYAAVVHGDAYIGRPTPSASMQASAPLRLPARAWHTPLTGLYLR